MYIDMKRLALLLAAALLALGTTLRADPFSEGRLLEQTLRLDYIFSGTDHSCDIAVAGLHKADFWVGRRVNLKSLALRGNTQVTMTDKASGDTLYRLSFNTLFQEWQATEEATRVRRSFENTVLVPMPAAPAEICVQLFDFHNNVVASLTHPVDPSDILIKPLECSVSGPAYRVLYRSGDPKDKIDVVIVPEGYAAADMETFWRDAQAVVDNLFSHKAFAAMKDRFNIIAVDAPSEGSGVSVPREGVWKKTVVDSNFDTFYMDRYLTTTHVFQMHDILAGVPYEHIIVLANTETYGGGGIYNAYTLTASHHAMFGPVVVHEFGHSFAGLADEYAYDDQYVEYYYPDLEPWERNITTKADFASKWQDMMGKDGVGLVEGGGYQTKGVWRPCENCRMRTNAAPDFCPVCTRAIEDVIRYNTEEL